MKEAHRFTSKDSPGRILSAERWQTIQANLFPAARPAVEPWQTFRWHGAAGNTCDTYKEHSSQALAIDVLGTLRVSPDRDRILDQLASQLGLPVGGPWEVQLEWHDPDNLLKEKQPTWVDAVAMSPQALIFFECKFCEADGGVCSQTQPLRTGKHRGLVQCNGAYTPQINPANGRRAACALTAKGIHYWDLIPEVFSIPSDLGYLRCPFAGPWFQWMRNLTVCLAAARHSNRQPAFVLVYADGPTLPVAERLKSDEWLRFTCQLRPNVIALQALSFQRLGNLAQAACPSDPLWADLSGWIRRKIGDVCRARALRDEM